MPEMSAGSALASEKLPPESFDFPMGQKNVKKIKVLPISLGVPTGRTCCYLPLVGKLGNVKVLQLPKRVYVPMGG